MSSAQEISTSTTEGREPLDVSTTAPPQTSSEGSAAVETMASPSSTLVRPGILIVSLYEGKGFSLPSQHQYAFGSQDVVVAGSLRPGTTSHEESPSNGGGINAKGLSPHSLPYALLDFDRVQVRVDAVSGALESPCWAGDDAQCKFDVTRSSELSVQFYLRNPDARSGSDGGEDLFLGACKVLPRFQTVTRNMDYGTSGTIAEEEEVGTAGKKEQELSQAGTEWIDLALGSGSIKIGITFAEDKKQTLQIVDFEVLDVVGMGFFGKLLKVRKRDTHRVYALKNIRRSDFSSRAEVAQILAGRSVLSQVDNPFIVPLKFVFQSPERLHLGLSFVNGEELFHQLQREQRFENDRARFYIAEVLCALESLHGLNVAYGDLKPENILLDWTGHIAMCDFGLCRLDVKDEDRQGICLKKPEYIAPELLLGEKYTKSVDYWTLGVLLYEMLTGLPPFWHEDADKTRQMIIGEPLQFPNFAILDPAAKDLLTRLLDRRPECRLGTGGASEIKAHAFFKGIDWAKVLQRRYEPSFKPIVTGPRNGANSGGEFTSDAPDDSNAPRGDLLKCLQQQFAGWSSASGD